MVWPHERLTKGARNAEEFLLTAYQGLFAVTGCAVHALLEAGHMIPQKGAQPNHVGNGLLLRGDWHTFSELRLVAVDADRRSANAEPSIRPKGFG